MREFAELFHDLDAITKTGDRIDLMSAYFRDADHKDAGWAAWFLAGNRIKGAVRTGELREWVAQRANLPLWLLEESYERVGDLAETISLLIRGDPQAVPMSLSEIVEQILYPLVSADSSESQNILLGVWNKLRPIDLLPFHKLLTGGFRIGVSRGNLCKALADVADVEPAVISQRISGDWDPRVRTYDRIVGEERAEDAWCRPFPFCLARPLQEEVETLGNPMDWWAEWK